MEEDNPINKRGNPFPQTYDKLLKNKQPNRFPCLLGKASRRLLISFQSIALRKSITWRLIKKDDKYNAKSRVLFRMTNSFRFQWSTIFYCQHPIYPIFKSPSHIILYQWTERSSFDPRLFPSSSSLRSKKRASLLMSFSCKNKLPISLVHLKTKR